MTADRTACHIAVLSIHPLYDTRIGNHIRTLVEEGYRVTYINWSKSLPDSPQPSFGSARLIHRDSDSAFGWNIFRFAGMLLWCLVQASRVRPNIVHLHDVLLLPLVLPLRLLGAKVVFDVHEHYTDFPGPIGSFSRLAYPLCLPFVDGFVGVVPSTLPKSTKPSRVVPNYQRRSDFFREESEGVGQNGAVTVVYFGSLSSTDRDLKLLLDTIEKVLERDQALRFKVGGRLFGPDSDDNLARLEELTRRYSERMHWFGEIPRQRVTQESATADIGLLLLRKDSPNIHSSSPNKIFEYLASGAAIVATDGFEIADEVRGTAGVLVAPGAKSDDVAAILLELSADRPRLARMRQASAELGRKYTWESVAVRYRELYEEILPSSAPGPAGP